MPEKPKLKIDWATHEAAKYACKNWHYSKCMPAGKLVKIGAWEENQFVGVVLFGLGANNNLASSFGLQRTECSELVRVALSSLHKTPVSKILSIAHKMMAKSNPGIRLIASYADKSNQNHHGGIYQASNYLYLGERSQGSEAYIVNGKPMHGRSVRAKWKKAANIPFPWHYGPKQIKHLYVYPLDKKLKFKSLPYPKRASSVESGTSFVQNERGGESPTDALQFLDP